MITIPEEIFPTEPNEKKAPWYSYHCTFEKTAFNLSLLRPVDLTCIAVSKVEAAQPPPLSMLEGVCKASANQYYEFCSERNKVSLPKSTRASQKMPITPQELREKLYGLPESAIEGVIAEIVQRMGQLRKPITISLKSALLGREAWEFVRIHPNEGKPVGKSVPYEVICARFPQKELFPTFETSV